MYFLVFSLTVHWIFPLSSLFLVVNIVCAMIRRLLFLPSVLSQDSFCSSCVSLNYYQCDYCQNQQKSNDTTSNGYDQSPVHTFHLRITAESCRTEACGILSIVANSCADGCRRHLFHRSQLHMVLII